MMDLFDRTAIQCAKRVTEMYSTSFTIGIRSLDKSLHDPIYSIYGFVRYADEIVDTMHDHNKSELLNRYTSDTWKAIEERVSLNPVLHAFQLVVNQYAIDHTLITAFLTSMEMDLKQTEYETDDYSAYIYGSAEVVGLMCLKVFCNGAEDAYQRLLPAARSLGSAFQKVNFLRDVQSDYLERGRSYFPGVHIERFDAKTKGAIERDIDQDLQQAFIGILMLPTSSRFGVYIAYLYYRSLLSKIKRTPAEQLLLARIRISDTGKLTLFVIAFFRAKLLGVYVR